jgi:acid phosphatase family membrane protein YuiD
MNMVSRLPLSLSLLSAAAVQIACQVFKVIYYSAREKKLALSWFVSAGGMPSAHSAFVTALTVSIGLWDGFATDLFAIACVFSIITIYDALRLRGAVEHHARILDQLVKSHPEVTDRNLNLRLGHNLTEIAAGVAAGGALAVLAWLVVRAF